jgi:hypothetical protein
MFPYYYSGMKVCFEEYIFFNTSPHVKPGGIHWTRMERGIHWARAFYERKNFY